MSSACLACHCAISTPFTGMRTIGVTGGTSPALAICARFSMYCRQSRSRPLSQGLCSISNTQPSYFDWLIPTAESVWAGAKQVSACWPASRARMTLLRRGRSAIWEVSVNSDGILSDASAGLAEARGGWTMPGRAVASGPHELNYRDVHDHRLPRPLHDRAEGPAPLPQGADR